MLLLRQILKTDIISDIICLGNGRVFGQNHILIKNQINNRLCSRHINTKYSATMEENVKFKFTDYDCIGFDLDNTLARYKVGNMIEMEHDIISKYLVNKKGYSKKYLLKPLDHNFLIKGLIVDDENGNLLRIAPDGKIIQATHGTKWLTREEIASYYPSWRWKATDLFTEDPLQTWNGPYSEKMRTLLDYYDIIISLIFARAVDSIDEASEAKHEKRVYNIWPDILEAAVYMFKREHFQTDEGEYFPEIKAYPEKYYYKCSEDLIKWLVDLKNNGKQLFLITGSHVDFASHTASNTIGPNWRDYFDVVVCYAKKPGFFTQRRDFVSLDGFVEKGTIPEDELAIGGIYTHGNWRDLKGFLKKHSMVENPKVLYIGDNLVQDIYTPNVFCKCDTVTVCEELEAERTHGFNAHWHPDRQFLISTVWGSYFHCKVTNSITNWYHIMREHSMICVPSLEYVASFPVDYEFPRIS